MAVTDKEVSDGKVKIVMRDYENKQITENLGYVKVNLAQDDNTILQDNITVGDALNALNNGMLAVKNLTTNELITNRIEYNVDFY